MQLCLKSLGGKKLGIIVIRNNCKEMKRLSISYIKEFIFDQKCIPWPLLKRWKESVIRSKFYELLALLCNVNTKEYWEKIWEKEKKAIAKYRFYPNKHNTILTLVPKNAKVLDVGCGLGILMQRLKEERNCEVIGVDISINAAEYVHRKGMKVLVAKVPLIPFKDNVFDVVIATEFLEHFPNPSRIYSEILRVLNDSGKFILSVPENHGPDTNREHLKTFTMGSLAKLISKYADEFNILRIKEEEGWCWHLLAYGTKGLHRPKHCLFLRRCSINAKNLGGLERQMINWFANIDYKKVKVSLALSSGKKNNFIEMIKKHNLPVKVIDFPPPPRRFLKRFLNMLFFLRKIKPAQIIYLQGGFGDFNIADVLAGYIYTKGNIFMSEHSGASNPPKKISRVHFGFIPGLGLWWYKQQFCYRLRAYLSQENFSGQ